MGETLPPYSATGAGLFYPEAYEDFVGHLEVSERSEVIRGYARRLCSADPEAEPHRVELFLGV